MKEVVEVPISTHKKRSLFLKNIILIFFTLLVCSFSISMGLLQLRTPEVIAHDESEEKFSSERAMKYLEIIAEKPRPIGSPNHDNVRDYLVSELTKLGVSSEIQVVKEDLTVWGAPYDGKIENIVARIPGRESTRAILLTSHYDSVDHSPGAADAGSGIAAILETIRVLSESKKLKNDIIILLSDGEEIGLLGAQAFAEFHPWAHEVGIVLNFEARGSSGPSVMFETSNKNERLITEFIKGATNPIAHSFISELYKNMPNDTDLSIYKEAGMSGLNFAFFETIHTYHSADDTVENLSLSSLQHHGENMLDLVRYYGGINLVVKEQGGNSVYFNSFGKKVISYPEYLVIPFMCILIVAFLITAILGFLRRKLTILGLIGGMLLFLLIIGMAYLLGIITKGAVLSILAESSWAMGVDLRMSHPLFITMILVMVGLFLLVYKLAQKKIIVNNLAVGAFFILVFMVIYTSLLIKGASYIFLWPTLLGLISLNVHFYVNGKWKWFGKGVMLVIAWLVIMFITPIVYITYMLLTLDNVGVLLVFIALLWAFFIPLINFNRGEESLCEST